MRFGPELPDYSPKDAKKWSLKCTVQVEKSADCTYFMVTGFGPGGYCGIQQLPNNERKAIFSMWNQENVSVYLVNAGEGVDVTGYLFSEDIFFKLAAPLQFNICRPYFTIFG